MLRIGAEGGAELCEIHLRLLARGGLKAVLEAQHRCRTQLMNRTLERGVTAGESQRSNLPQQPHRAQLRKCLQPIAQERQIRIDLLRTWIPWPINRRLKTARDVLAYGLAVQI